jgi:ribosomal peptide maturation radical SAM protein 1
MAGAPLRVALVNMPFASTRYPSIQLGLLQAILTDRGIPTVTHYLNLNFAARIGWMLYENLTEGQAYGIGDWIFSRAAFGNDAPPLVPGRELFASALGLTDAQHVLLTELREREAPKFIDHCLATVPWEDYDVVGFGSVFAQNCAALALARRIKKTYPRIFTIFGGANFEGEMGEEYLRVFPWIDYAVIGEGDEALPALLDRLAVGEDATSLPGVAHRRQDGIVSAVKGSLVRDLNALPAPDYTDFFAAAAELRLPDIVNGRELAIPFESARGCWWGAKHHCTFCGLNGPTMAFRSKLPERVLSEIDTLARRYQNNSFWAVDNILDHRYVQEVFARIAEQGRQYRFFYEVKANLTQEQLRVLALGGMRSLQPGIESLDNQLLKLIKKGTTAIINVRFLKWAHHYGISVVWNLLHGIPGERAEDYENQLSILRLITHLPPPSSLPCIAVMRFSPYHFDAEAFGILNVRPSAIYSCIYPEEVDLRRIAYLFDYDTRNTVSEEVFKRVEEHVQGWRELWKRSVPPFLQYENVAGRLMVEDGRCPGRHQTHVLEEPEALIYEFCGASGRSAHAVCSHLRENGIDLEVDDVQHRLERLARQELMLRDCEQYLSLALPA